MDGEVHVMAPQQTFEDLSDPSVCDFAEDGFRKRHQGARVLVVEDDAGCRLVAEELLAPTGLHLEFADDGLQAVELARQTRYDLIAMDLSLPALNGIDAARQIRALPGRRRTPIVAVTANVLPLTRQECLDAGITEFVYKPYTAGGLLLTVLKCLDQVRA